MQAQQSRTFKPDRVHAMQYEASHATDQMESDCSMVSASVPNTLKYLESVVTSQLVVGVGWAGRLSI
jgi:hypothetical protein